MHRLWTDNLRYRWSAIRHSNSPVTTKVRQDLIPKKFEDIVKVAKTLRSNFVYTHDGIDRLFDSIDTPASCWERAFNPGPLEDDCDGFHSALYWAVHQNFNCWLLTLVTRNIVNSHVILYIQHNGHYYVDYEYMSSKFNSFEALIEHIGKRRSMNIVSYNLSSWKDGWQKGGK